MMKTRTKSVGKIKKSNSVGLLYPSPAISLESSITRTHSSSTTKHSNMVRSSSQKKCSSVGQIYTTKYFNSKPEANDRVLLKRYGPSFINYDEIENKLSNYLQCTVNTNCRLKYNYLSQHQYPLTQNINYNVQALDRHIRSENKPQTKEREHNFNTATQGRASLNRTVKNEKPLIEKYQNIQNNKENINFVAAIPRKQSICGLAGMDHEQNKSKLQNKLKKMIEDYENKQKQLTAEMKKIQQANKKIAKQKQEPNIINKRQTTFPQPNLSEAEQTLKDIFQKLLQFNLKGICLSPQSDLKLEQIWKQMHKQIILDQQLRVSKSYINEENIELVLNAINESRIKKLDLTALKTHTDQYDPFLIQKASELFKKKNITLTDKVIVKCIANIFVRNYEQSERHWIKFFSPEQMERTFRTMVLERQINGQQQEGKNTELNSRDLARYLSILFKANLRSRNIYQITKKLKNIAFAGRFIELLQQRTEKANQNKRTVPVNK